MNRRDFCKNTLQLGLFSAASSLFSLPSWALQQLQGPPQFLLLIRLAGGWDTSLCTNPWILPQRPQQSDCFIEYTEDKILRGRNITVGPGLQPLQNYFDRMSIINGLFMTATDGGHDSSALYASSGNGEGHLGVLPASLESLFFHSPFGMLANRSVFTGEKGPSVWDLSSLINSRTVMDAESLWNFAQDSSELSQARANLRNYKKQINLFNKSIEDIPDLTSPLAIAKAFSSGLSYSAYYNISTDLDTHSAHERAHLNNLTKAFFEVKDLLDSLAQEPGIDARFEALETQSLLDQTTVMIVSEFTRTPAMNASEGKDHNPQSNSTILISPHLRSGMIGDSQLITRSQSTLGAPYWASKPLDLKTFEPVNRREGSFIMRPENVVATVVSSLGVDPAKISPSLGSARILTSLLKNS
ncbi:MAG: DUF1501 domain-containing protein [Bdellovibrio sp.]